MKQLRYERSVRRFAMSRVASTLRTGSGAAWGPLDLVDDGDELARARELAEKRQRSFGGLDRVTAQRRLSAYLMRRGFSGSAVRAAVDSVQPASGVRFR